MATRKETIIRAQGRNLQGTVDPLISTQEWGDYYQDAIDRVWQALLGEGVDFFVKRKFVIPHTSNGVYTLPEDFFNLLWVQEPGGAPVYTVGTIERERTALRVGFRLLGKNLLLVNWQGDFPATLEIDYQFRPKELPDYDGVDTVQIETGFIDLENAISFQPEQFVEVVVTGPSYPEGKTCTISNNDPMVIGNLSPGSYAITSDPFFGLSIAPTSVSVVAVEYSVVVLSRD